VLATEHPTSVKKLFDTATINLSFSDGSTATIHYLANGHKSFSKERIEVFTNGRILRLDNFRTLEGWGWPNFSRKSLWRQNKGQAECAQEFLTSTILSNRKSAESLFDVSQIAIELAEKMHLEY
jgi:predicted dehydrogenase